MTYEQARETLLKMAFAESTEFAEDRLFAFGYSDEHEALMIAIDALEKQIPKTLKDGSDWDRKYCPNCGTIFGADGYYDEFDYCTDCGQRLERGGVDEY